jgi:predicted GTPase
MPKLKLKVTHTHAGVAYPAGHVLDVDEHTARWLTDPRSANRPAIAPSRHRMPPMPR